MWNDGTDVLMHHGIKGQKWGIRRYQNPDGTLTEAGKKRYYDKSGKLTKKGIDEYARKNREYITKEIEIAKSKVNTESLNQKSDKLNTIANSISKDYDKLYKQLNTNANFKNDCKKYLQNLKKSYGLDVDDDELIELFGIEAVNETLLKYTPKELLNKLDDLESAQKDYWDEVHSYSQSIIDKYGEIPVTDSDKGMNYTSAKDYVRQYVDWHKDQKWNAYLFRHFEDYWINDLDSRYDLVASIID